MYCEQHFYQQLTIHGLLTGGDQASTRQIAADPAQEEGQVKYNEASVKGVPILNYHSSPPDQAILAWLTPGCLL